MHCKMLLKYLPIQVMLLGSAEGLFYFTAWKCINLNFSHQNHYKLHVKVRIYSQTCSTNSTGCVQSCTEVYKLNMTWVMLDMDNSAPFPNALLGICVQSSVPELMAGTGEGALAHLIWLQKLNISKWVCASWDPVLW